MNYVLLAIIASVILFFWMRQKKIHSRTPCERCGEVGNTISYFASTNNTTRDYCKVFGDFLYEKPLNFCLWCATAHDSFLRALIMLSIEKQQNFGRNDQIREAEKIWGDRAIDMLALLQVARGSMDSARRILKEEEFKKVKPWLEKMLGEVMPVSIKNNNADDLLIEQISSLKWGMPKPEYRELFSNKKWHTQEHPTLNAMGFFDDYLGYQFFVVAYFLDGSDRLAKIDLGLDAHTDLVDSDEHLRDIYGKLVGKLTKIYGSPQFSDIPDNDSRTPPEYKLSEIKKWKTKDSIISITLILADTGSPNPGVGVNWGDIKNDPLSRQWDKSGFSDQNKPQKLPKDFKFSEAQIEEIKRAMENNKGN